MSLFSRVVLIMATVIALGLLLAAKGLPAAPPPDPKAITDVVLQPVLAVIWGLVGYLGSAVFFGAIVTVAVKVVRMLVSFVVNPSETVEAVRAALPAHRDVP